MVGWTTLWTGSLVFRDSPGHLGYLYKKRPIWKFSEILPTSLSAWAECLSSGSPNFPACTGGVEHSQLVTGDVRVDCGTLPWSLLLLVSQEARARGGRTGAGACTGHPLHPPCPRPPRRRLLPGKRCRTGVQSAGRTWWLSPARLPLLLLVPASVPRVCAPSRVPPRFLTRLQLPSAGSSARSARLEAEPRAALLPSPALQKALHRPAWSGRQKGPWMGRGRERMRVPKGARWRGKVRCGAGLCGS